MEMKNPRGELRRDLAGKIQLNGGNCRGFLDKARRQARAYAKAICKRRTTKSLRKKIKQALCFDWIVPV
jgi:hypothetical protein